jgi:catechol 2,3-dioxygenase-like lactoylglutathione lyase family enzyme
VSDEKAPRGPGGFHHAALLVRDLAAVEPFYRDLLQLPVIRRWPAADGRGVRSVWLDVGAGGFLALERASSESPASTNVGWNVLVLAIERGARRDWLERFTKAGVQVFRRTPHTLYVCDPEGNRVGLSHWPHAAQAADDGDDHV